jgi:hypothetical protein
MAIKEIATIKFTDDDSGQEAVAIVRAAEGQVALCLSLARDGDVEVYMRRDAFHSLLDALQQAASVAEARRGE